MDLPISGLKLCRSDQLSCRCAQCTARCSGTLTPSQPGSRGGSRTKRTATFDSSHRRAPPAKRQRRRREHWRPVHGYRLKRLAASGVSSLVGVFSPKRIQKNKSHSCFLYKGKSDGEINPAEKQRGEKKPTQNNATSHRNALSSLAATLLRIRSSEGIQTDLPV